MIVCVTECWKKAYRFFGKTGRCAHGLVLLACAAIAGGAHAYDWTGAASTDFYAKGNWSGNDGHLWVGSAVDETLPRELVLTKSQNYVFGSGAQALNIRGASETASFILHSTPGSAFTYDNTGAGKDEQRKIEIGVSTRSAALWFYNGTLKTKYLRLGNDTDATQTGWLKLGNETDATTLTTGGNIDLRSGKLIVTEGATLTGAIAYLGNVENGDFTLEQNGGALTLSRMWLGTKAGATVRVYHRAGETKMTASDSRIGLGACDNATTTSYFEMAGGTLDNTAGSQNFFAVGHQGVSASATMLMTGGEIYSGPLYIAEETGGTLTISNGVWCTKSGTGTVFCQSAKCTAEENGILNLCGGTLETDSVTYGAGSGAAVLTFDGGTLKAGAEGTLIARNENDKLTVLVGAAGGTIDTDGKTVTIAADLADAADESGKMTFTGGGCVKLTGAAGYTGATTIEAGTALYAADGTQTFAGTLALNDTANLVVACTSESAVAAPAITLPETGKVSIQIATATEPEEGLYTILEQTGAGTFAADDAAKFTCATALSSGVTFSVSADGKKICLAISSNSVIWTGLAGDNNLLTAGNWLKEGVAVVPDATSQVVFQNAEPLALTCNGAFSAKSMVFKADSAKVTISGTGSLTIAETIANASEAIPVIDVQVSFVSGDAAAAIDVTGAVDFQDGVTGTVPANHTTFYGKYTLTAKDWTLPKAITLKENATVTGSGTTLKTGGYPLNAESGAVLTLATIKPTAAGNIFGTFAGDLTVDTLYPEIAKNVTFNAGFTGTLRIKDINFHEQASNGHTLAIKPDPSANIVLGGGDFKVKKGTLNIEGLSVKSSADWVLKTEQNGYNVVNTITLGSAGISIDTADFDDPSAAGHTVTVTRGPARDNILKGSGSVTATGNGSLVFETTAQFTGGLIAKDTVTIGLNKGVHAGAGDITLQNASTLDLCDSSGTVPGTLTLAGGTTLKIRELATGRLPLDVGALAFDGASGENPVTLRIDAGSLAAGYYALVDSGAALPADVALAFTLAFGETVEKPADVALYVQGNTLFLKVGDTTDMPAGVWIGGVDSDMSNPFNWKNLALPAAGSTLDFTAETLNKTINADLDVTFATADLGTAARQITIGGGTLKLQTLTVGTPDGNFSVAEGAKLSVAGNVTITHAEKKVCYIVYNNRGTVEIVGKVVTDGKVLAYPCYNCSETATIAVSGLVSGSTGDHFKLNAYTGDAPTVNWIIGADGLSSSGTTAFWIDRGDGKNDHGEGATLQAAADFTIAANIGARQTLNIDTGDGKTVAATSVIWGVPASGTSNNMTVSGTGRFVCNYQTTTASDPYTGAITVKNGATLALNAGKIATKGQVTVKEGGTLEVAQSGTVALAGDLALNDGATLAFTFTARRTTPVLDLTDKTVTFGEAASVKVAVGGAYPSAMVPHTLTAGGKFAWTVETEGSEPTAAEATIVKAESSARWVKALGVNDAGDIALAIVPQPYAIILR